MPGHRRPEQRREHHPDGDHHQAHPQVEAVGPGPRRSGAPRRDDVARDREDQPEQQRVRGAAGGGRQADGPQPPGARVQRTQVPQRRQVPGHGAARVRRDRSNAAPPSTATRATPSASPAHGGPPAPSSPVAGARRGTGGAAARRGRAARRRGGRAGAGAGGGGGGGGLGAERFGRLAGPRGLGRGPAVETAAPLAVPRDQRRGRRAGARFLAACGQMVRKGDVGRLPLAALLPHPGLGGAGVRVVAARALGGIDPAARTGRAPPVRPVGVGGVARALGEPVDLADLTGLPRDERIAEAGLGQGREPAVRVAGRAQPVRRSPPASRPSTMTPTHGFAAATTGADGPSSARPPTLRPRAATGASNIARQPSDRPHRSQHPLAGQPWAGRDSRRPC